MIMQYSTYSYACYRRKYSESTHNICQVLGQLFGVPFRWPRLLFHQFMPNCMAFEVLLQLYSEHETGRQLLAIQKTCNRW